MAGSVGGVAAVREANSLAGAGHPAIKPLIKITCCPPGDEGQNRGACEKPARALDGAETVGAEIPSAVDGSNRQCLVQFDRNRTGVTRIDVGLVHHDTGECSVIPRQDSVKE